MRETPWVSRLAAIAKNSHRFGFYTSCKFRLNYY